MVWEQELYNNFKYLTPRTYFHTFAADVSLKKLIYAVCRIYVCYCKRVTEIIVSRLCNLEIFEPRGMMTFEPP